MVDGAITITEIPDDTAEVCVKSVLDVPVTIESVTISSDDVDDVSYYIRYTQRNEDGSKTPVTTNQQTGVIDVSAMSIFRSKSK